MSDSPRDTTTTDAHYTPFLLTRNRHAPNSLMQVWGTPKKPWVAALVLLVTLGDPDTGYSPLSVAHRARL
eukprot:2333761-Pyramimonas_sp.AAC.1